MPTRSKELSITINELPSKELSGNKRLGWAGQHRAKREQVGVWLYLLRDALGPPPWPTFDAAVKVAIHVTGTGKRIDPDNWVAGNSSLKVLMDCLTARSGFGLGIIRDDSPGYVKSYRVQVDTQGEPQTQIHIQEVGDGTD